MPKNQWRTLSDGSILTRQEQYVLQRVEAGEIADLKKKFGEAEEDRRLRARFLEELLTGKLQGVEVHRKGVRVRNAVVEEAIDLEGAIVHHVVSLPDCKFQGDFSLRDSYFHKHLFINRGRFEKKANFIRIKVGRNLYLDNTIFQQKVNFGGADIGGQFSGDKARFEGKEHEVNFNPLKVGRSAFFREAVFMGPVDFGSADIGKLFHIRGAHFANTESKANFTALKVGLDFFCHDAVFQGPVDFVRGDIKGQLMANGVKFLASNHKADFTRIRVGNDAFFWSCDFFGVVSFVKINIAGNMNLYMDPLERKREKRKHDIATTFHSDVNFHGAEIGGEFRADKTQFLGHISNFEAIRVGRSFHASGALFDGSVYFSDMQVRNNFYIDPVGRMRSFKTLFKGAANFTDLEVRGVFNADQAIFQSDSVIFSGLRVGKGAFFNGTIFFAGLVIKEAQLNDLEIRGLHRLSKGGLPLNEIVLNRTKIDHRLTIEDLEVKRFDARNLEVKGPAEFRRLFIKGEADFRDAALHHLQLVEVDWPEPPDGGKKVFLDGLTFESITTRRDPEQPEAWPKLLAWLGLSRFNTQNYRQLDAYLQRGGLRRWADKVFIAGKRRELSKLKWWHPANWLARFFWGLLAGYGRKPGRALGISLALIILGAFLFNPATVIRPEFLNSLAGYYDNAAHPIAMRLIMSFANFVSAIPGWSGHLNLSSPEFHLFVFIWFQRLCGWILIPIGLAAIYSRLK